MVTQAAKQRAGPADYGEWQGAELNRLVPELRSMGYDVAPGTLDMDGCGLVDPDGRRKRLVLLSPGVSEIRDDPEDEAPSDQFPDLEGRYALMCGRPADAAPRPMVSYRGGSLDAHRWGGWEDSA